MNAIRTFLLLTLALASVPLAASPADSDEHDRRGKVLYGKGDLEGALAEFRAAYEAEPRPALLFNAAKTLERLGRTREAFETYERYLFEAPGAAEREAAAGVLAGLCPDVGRGLVRILSDPPGARLTIDGAAFPVPATAAVCLAPGRHEVAATKPGFEPARQSVEVPPGSAVDVRLTLARAMGNGTVRVLSEVMPATVLLDGVRAGAAPLDVAVPAGGPHELTIDAGEAWLPWRRTVEVKEGHSISVRALPERRPAPIAAAARPTDASADGSAPSADPNPGPDEAFNWGWVTLGAAAVLAITGGVLYGVAYDRVSTADGLDPTDPDYDTRFDDLSGEGRRLQIGAFVTWGLAAVTGLSTAVLWEPGAPAAPAASRGPRPPFVGLTVGGTF